MKLSEQDIRKYELCSPLKSATELATTHYNKGALEGLAKSFRFMSSFGPILYGPKGEIVSNSPLPAKQGKTIQFFRRSKS